MPYQSDSRVVDLFCGAGGLTRGLLNQGLSVVAGYDVDEYCKFPYEYNNIGVKFFLRDVATVGPEEIQTHFLPGSPSVLVGCAPCQPFSKYQRQPGPEQQKKWGLLNHVTSLVDALRPDVVSVENVPNLQGQSIFQKFLKCLKRNDYYLNHQIISCRDFGVPQVRKRLVLLASRCGPIELTSLYPLDTAKKMATVRYAVGTLSELKAGQQSEKDRLHRCPRLTPINLERIRASKPGGTWRDWPLELRARCHQRTTGETYPSVYGRMCWSAPGPTITTQFYGYGNGRFGHPKQDRALSLREGALLQTFPPDYKFEPEHEKLSFPTIGRMIGNAVPVLLGEAIGQAIRENLRRYYSP